MGRIAAAGFVVTLTLVASTVWGQGSAPAVKTTVAERSRFQETVHLDGVIEAVQQSTVSAQTSGTVQKLPFDVDDSVAAGDLIVQLEDSEQQSRLNQAQAGLEEAEAALTDASQRFARIEEVHARGLVSRQEFDQARNNLAAARARVERARAAVAEAEEQLSYTRVVAPYGGILTERHVELGEAVSPGQPCSAGCRLSSSGLWLICPRSMQSWHATSVRPGLPWPMAGYWKPAR
jgi:RND family efflux transporter MFP subunit